MNLKQRAKKLKSDIPILYLVLKDKKTPAIVKIIGGLTIVYALSPIDLIPDFIPVLGYLDDVILLPALIALTLKFIPQDIWEDNRKKVEQLSENKQLKKWYYSIPVLLIWIIFGYIVVKFFCF